MLGIDEIRGCFEDYILLFLFDVWMDGWMVPGTWRGEYVLGVHEIKETIECCL